MNEFIFSQLIATLAFFCGFVSFQCKSRSSILLWLSGSSFTNACHFLVLNKPVPAILYFILTARALVARVSLNQNLMYLFLSLSLFGSILFFKGPLGFLALFATILATYGSFQKEVRRVRILFMLSATMWVVHNILVWTPVALLMQVMFLISNGIGFQRFDKKTPSNNSGTEFERSWKSKKSEP